MAFARRLALFLSLTSLGVGCQPKQEVSAEQGSKKLGKKEGAKPERKHEAKGAAEPGKFIVPFAWEAAKDEPLAQTRAFLADVLTDNQAYMEHGGKFFARFAEKETPRATVLTCADSRIHTTAWDVTPENDDFVIRNLGNQVETAPGSIEYGIEHLRTPLLFVIGHTGCSAVKAAMGDMSKLSGPLQKELEHMHVPKAAPNKPAEAAWTEAVIANVNHQVETALKHFGKDVQGGQLTIVGGVYDFRNDLQQGAGKLVIVNVNGNAEPARMTAFVDAVASAQSAKGASDTREADKKPGKAKKFDDTAAAAEIAAQLAKLRRPEATNGDAKPRPAAEVSTLGRASGH